MKINFTLLLFYVCLLTNCSLDNRKTIDNQEVTIIQWHLINVTGGFAGVDHDFEMGDIIWRFDNVNSALSVENNNTDDTLEDSLDTGTYDQYFFEEDDKLFLFIDNNDYGLIIISEDDQIFTLNQNITSSGNGADGFIYEFKREVIVIN